MTKYRQTFTIEAPDNLGYRLQEYINDHGADGVFDEAGESSGVAFADISWTAPERIVEVPQGLGAVVVDGAGRVWVRTDDDEEEDRWRQRNGQEFADDEVMRQLLSESGAEIKSHGVEL